MPFRIKVSLAILALLVVLTLGLPLALPIRPLTGTQPAAALADPDSRFVEVNGLRVHYKLRGAEPGGAQPADAQAGGAEADGAQPGDGEADAAGRAAAAPAFVLLHDFGGSTYSWHAVMDELAALGTVVAFDRPAFGLTERPAPGSWTGVNPYGPAAQVALTVDLMTALGIERAVLVGHSVGATVALETAAAHPERVRALVLADPAVYQRAGAPAWARWLLGTPQFDRLGPVIMRQLAGETGDEVIRNGWAHPENVPDASMAAYRKGLQVDGWDVALWQYTRANGKPAVVGELAAVEQPTLVVTGALDRVVPPADSGRLALALPDAELVTLPGCGHVPQEECPAPFLEAVTSWLASTAP